VASEGQEQGGKDACEGTGARGASSERALAQQPPRRIEEMM